MSRSSYRSGHERSRRGRRFLLLLLLALLLGTAYWLRPGPKAEIRIEPALPAVGPSTSISLEVREPSRGLTSVQVEILQGEHSWTISSFDRAERSAWTPWGAKITTHETTFEVGRENQRELGPGEVVVRVLAIGDGPWLRSRTAAETRLPVDLEAPALVPLTESATVRQGGSGALVYSAGEDAARHGVRVGDVEVEGVPLPADPRSDQPPATDSRQHFVLYGVPFDLSDPSEIRLFATDAVGNRVELPFLQRFDTRDYPRDEIQLSDAFFAKVVPEILGRTPEIQARQTPLESYLLINRELRQRNAETLAALHHRSRSERSWSGPFEQLPQSRVMAGFGDHRSYLYDGEEVDAQVHLGYDLASRSRAPVPAANHGIVLFADYLGIYGNTVVLDHGFGLLTLYSHLSEITVPAGREVAKGDVLGRTGVTGLSGGDHLHYSVLLGGIQVDPLEWWDRRWIETRISAILGPSFEVDTR